MSASGRAAFALALAVGLAALPGVAEAGGRGHGHGRHGHGHHHGGSRFVYSFGPYWGPAWYGPRYYYPYPYAYPVYPAPVYLQPRVVVQEPPVYIERDAVPAAPAAQEWWYYCESSGAYYPDVESCAEPWLKVPPRSN